MLNRVEAPLEEAQLPQITVETNFMQNYRIASAVNGGGEVVAVRNKHGQVELFTLGTDNTVWNFYPDPKSDTGYSNILTGLKAPGRKIAAGIDSQGRIVAFAAQEDLQLHYSVENDTAARWSAPASIAVQGDYPSTGIAKIVVKEIANTLYVGVLEQIKGQPADTNQLVYSQWQTAAPSFQKAPMYLYGHNCVWLGNNAQNVAFACVGCPAYDKYPVVSHPNTVIMYTLYTRQPGVIYTTEPLSSLSVDNSPDGAGNNQTFAILDDGNVYRLKYGLNDNYSWDQIARGMSFCQVLTRTDSYGLVQVFAISADNKLYHLDPRTGYTPVVLQSNAAIVAGASNSNGNLDLFLIGTGHSSLTHFFQEQQSTRWVAEKVEVPTGDVEEYRTYTSEVTVHDALGARLINTPVKIWATEEALVTVNSSTYFVNIRRPARVSTNGAGILTLVQESTSLGIPTLKINLPDLMAPDQAIVIQQSTVVRERLASVSGSEILQANILEPPYNTTSTADALADNIRKCMAITQPAFLHATHPSPVKLAGTPGAWFLSGEAATDLDRLGGFQERLCWQTSFQDGKVSSRDLSREEAEALRAELRAAIQKRNSSAGGWLSGLGDFLAGVVNGVINIFSTIVETVKDGVHVFIQFFINGAEDFIDIVISTLGQAFEVVEILLADVKVTFKKLFAWLGFIFNWNDMRYTQEALIYTVDQLLQFALPALQGLQKTIDDGFGKFENQIHNLFSEAINRDGQSSIGGYAQKNKPSVPEYGPAVAHNFLCNALIDNMGHATLLPAGAFTADAALLTSVNSIMEEITRFVEPLERKESFANLTQCFQTLGKDSDQIFNYLLAGLLSALEAIAESVVSGIQTIVDALLQMTESLVEFVRTLLTRSWQIPFVSKFYEHITGTPLTALSLMALVAAIPATIIYKVIEGVAPFPDAHSLQVFKASFNYQSMLQAAGFTRNVGALPLPPETAKALGQLNAFCIGIFGVFTARLDALQPVSLAPSEESLVGTSIFVAVLELASQALSFPWFTSPTRVPGAVIWSWGWVGLLLDLVFLVYDQKFPENGGDLGVGMECFYAVIHLIMALFESITGEGKLHIPAAILPAIPELAKMLRFSTIAEASDGASLAVLAIIDLILYTATGYVIVKVASSSN